MNTRVPNGWGDPSTERHLQVPPRHATGSRAADPRKAANGDWLRSEMLEVPVPLENGGRAIVLLPPDGSFTMDDADRMGAAVRAWVIPEPEPYDDACEEGDV
jgi:hypothetical protein